MGKTRLRMQRLFGERNAVMVTGLPKNIDMHKDLIKSDEKTKIKTIREIKGKIDTIVYEQRFFSLVKKELLDTSIAFAICNAGITTEFLEDVLIMEDMRGFILLRSGRYIGFVFYLIKQRKDGDYIEIELLCASKRDGTLKGLSVGRTLLRLVDIDAKRNKIDILKLDSVPEALGFYKSDGYVVMKNKSNGLIRMEKSISGKVKEKKKRSFLPKIFRRKK